jgi:hypothetical protein
MTTAAKKVKTTAAVFELSQKLGILQYVEYEPPPRERCAEDGRPYEAFTKDGVNYGGLKTLLSINIKYYLQRGCRWKLF